MRVASMGTYRCGSSAVAKSLTRLGVHLGEPFFGEYFESDSLSALLRHWWNEPEHKLKRDLKILREEVCDKPDNARWWYFLGQTLAALGQHEGAVEALDRCVNLRQWSEQSAWASFMAAKSLSELGRYGEALERCGIGLACDPAYPELAWMAAWCEFRAGPLRNAIAWAQMSIAIGHAEGTFEGSDRVGFRNLVGWYEGPLDVLRFTLRRQGRTAEAEGVETRYQAAETIRVKMLGA